MKPESEIAVEGQPDWAPVRALVEQWRKEAFNLSSSFVDAYRAKEIRECADALEALLPLLPGSE